jgi:hypothetical protein
VLVLYPKLAQLHSHPDITHLQLMYIYTLCPEKLWIFSMTSSLCIDLYLLEGTFLFDSLCILEDVSKLIQPSSNVEKP